MELFNKDIITTNTVDEILAGANGNSGTSGATVGLENGSDDGGTTVGGRIIGGSIEGGAYYSNLQGARVEIFPEDDNTIGFASYDVDGVSVFKTIISGTDIGDVILGNYSGGAGAKWDQSGGTFTVAGTITATSGTIGGWTINSTSIYATTTGEIKTSANVGVGYNGVIMDKDGIRMYDSVLGEVVNLPSDGSAPEFASGTITETTFEISTNAVLRTSSTVGDGTADSAGVLINSTGVYGCTANQLLAAAQFRIIASTGAATFGGTLAAPGGYLGHIELCPSCYGYIASGQTDFNTGTGFWLGEAEGQHKLSIGSSTGNRLTWDGSYLRLIGSFDVGTDGLINNSVYTVANLPVVATEVGFNDPTDNTVTQLVEDALSYWKLDGDSVDAEGTNDGTDTFSTEDLDTNYTEVDASTKLTVNDTTITVSGLTNGVEAYVYKDFGVNYFSGNFIHQFEVNFSANTASTCVWAMTNDIDDIYALRIADKDLLLVGIDGYEFQLYGFEAGEYTDIDRYQGLVDTTYYCSIKRDVSVGTYGTIYLYIYSDSGRTTLLDTLTVALTGDHDFRYLFGVNSFNTGAGNSSSGTIANLRLNCGYDALFGKINQGAGFNGSTSKIAIADDSSLKPTGDFSVSGWFKTTNIAENYIFQSYNNDSANKGILIYFADGRLRFATHYAAGQYQLVSSDADVYGDGNWHFFAAVSDGTNLNLYIDDDAVLQAEDVYGVAYNATNLVRIGCQYASEGNLRFFNGAIDEVGIWEKALTPTEVEYLYNSGSGIAHPFDSVNDPEEAYASDDTYATFLFADADVSISLSKDGGSTYHTVITETFTGVEGSTTFGDGETELWGTSWTRANMIDGSFWLKIECGDAEVIYKDFGFATGTEILTGIEIVVEGYYSSSVFYLDHIKVKIHYGTSILPVQVGSMAFASDGRKAGEGVGAGTGLLVYYDGTNWIASDTGATVDD